jgi:transposase
MKCKRDYTPVPRKWVYSDEERKAALRLMSDGATGRAVGRQLKMSKSNAYRWSNEYAKKGT